MTPNPECPCCEQELAYLDRVRSKTGESYNLWACHNEDCDCHGTVWNDAQPGHLNRGDPAGLY